MDYKFADDYTLGYHEDDKIIAYKEGRKMSLEEANVSVRNKENDDVFDAKQTNGKWDDEKITLTNPIQYTTEDGKAHDIDSMLTQFDFVADPTAIDNTDNDGKLYVYGTTEGIEYSDGVLAKNEYNNHSLTILSTKDMVNWTDEGFLDNLNLNNDKSDAANKVKCGWGDKAWAPSGLKIDGDGDGKDEYYIFYTNGGAVGYVQGDSPNGPWKDDLGEVLFWGGSPKCEGVVWCFDPAVLVDDKGDAYIYFGGGVKDDLYAHGKTARVCKIKFEKGTGKVLLDGEPMELDNYYMFEDSEINQFNGKYFYSYCVNFDVPDDEELVSDGEIAAYVSTDPMKISFAPDEKGLEYTDEEGIYHHYLGSILDNPSVIYGESYNNHHHMQSYKGHDYMFYHSTVLSNTLYRDSKQYRNLHVVEIDIDEKTDAITIIPTYEGAKQIEAFNPYEDYINATTSATSAGVKSTRDDLKVEKSLTSSPMVLDDIQTGDWICIKGVDFGADGLKSLSAEVCSATDEARIEVFVDSPNYLKNKVASIDVKNTDGKYDFMDAVISSEVKGIKDVYFVFRGSDYKVATWSMK